MDLAAHSRSFIEGRTGATKTNRAITQTTAAQEKCIPEVTPQVPASPTVEHTVQHVHDLSLSDRVVAFGTLAAELQRGHHGHGTETTRAHTKNSACLS